MKVEINSFQSQKGLSVVQFNYGKVDSLEYVSGPSMLRKGLLNITEVSESGNVNMIKILNDSDKYVFFSDSDILEGAKQNRVLNASIYLSPKSETLVPVTCIERGRWRYSKSSFDKSDYTIDPELRKQKSKSVSKNLEETGDSLADQMYMWNSVSEIFRRRKINSDTEDFSETYKKRPPNINEFAKVFNCDENSNGVAFFYNSTLLNIDIFNRCDIYIEYFPKMISASVNEVYHMICDVVPDENSLKEKTEILLSEYDNIPKKIYQTIGVGKDLRFQNEKILGSNLIFEETFVHLNVLEL